MNTVWNLDPIYSGFECDAYKADMEKLGSLAASFAEFAGSLTSIDPLDGLKQGIAKIEELTELVGKLAEYASLRQSTNTRDSVAGSKMGQIMQILGMTAGPQAIFQEWVASLPNLMELVEKDPVLAEYKYYFENLKLDSTHLLGAKGEEICARLGLSGGSAWSDLQQYLTSTVPVSYNGTTTNLSSIRNLAYDPGAFGKKGCL